MDLSQTNYHKVCSFALRQRILVAVINQQNRSHYSCQLEDGMFSDSPGISLCLMISPLGDAILWYRIHSSNNFILWSWTLFPQNLENALHISSFPMISNIFSIDVLFQRAVIWHISAVISSRHVYSYAFTFSSLRQ